MAKLINKYRIWCITENEFVYSWGEEAPTACPNNPEHTIDNDNIVRIDKVAKNDVNISDVSDELERPIVRAESRDPTDTTYFTCKGDKWESVEGEEVGSGDGSATEFQLANKEVKNVVVKVDGEVEENVTIDKTQYDEIINESIHFGTGKITFDTAPANGSVITADYEYAVIGGGAELIYDQSEDGNSKTIDISFCDPAHIKDGLVAFENGAFDSLINVYAVCPQYGTYVDDRLPATGVYKDDNGNIVPAIGAEKLISYYVINQRLLGTVYVGLYFDVEARSTAMPPGYKIRVVVNAGSATELKAYARLEINRERTTIK